MDDGKRRWERKRRSFPALIVLIAPLLIVGAVLWWSVSDDLDQLVNGETAVVTEVTKQAGDSSPNAEAPSAVATWRFPDRRHCDRSGVAGLPEAREAVVADDPDFWDERAGRVRRTAVGYVVPAPGHEVEPERLADLHNGHRRGSSWFRRCRATVPARSTASACPVPSCRGHGTAKSG